MVISYLYSFLPLYAQELGLSIGEIKGESDHIHFLLQTKPTDTLSSIIGTLKCKSTSFLYSKGHKFPFWGKLSKTLWSSGYFVCSTGGVSIEVLENYIKNQGVFK